MTEGNRDLQLVKHRWLRPDEICEVLRNPKGVAISEKPPVMPPSGSIFLFDKKVQKHFRNDGYNWKKAKDGRTKEGHEKLKVEGLDTLHCYYAHGKEDQSLQRRIYWMIEENLSHMVLVHYRVVKGEKRKARYIEETQTAEGVQHSRKTYEITSNCEKDNFDSSSFNPSNFQHSQATESACDGFHGGNTVTPGFLDSTHNGRVKQEEGDDINQVRKQPKVTCGQKVSATQSHSRLERIYLSSNDSEDETLAVGTAPHQVQEFDFANQQGEVIAWNNPGASDVPPTIDSLGCDFQFNIPDSQSNIYTQQDDETTRLDAFHIANPTMAATSTIGPIHLNPYTIANVADQAHLPVPQPTATIGVDIAAATNKTATVGTAPPQVQEFDFANQQGEVTAWNNPGASDVQPTIDSLGCDFQFNIQDSQSMIYTQQDDETWDAFHIANPTMAATSTIGPIHLNPYTIANVADQAHPPVPQPTATIGVDIATTTNKIATVGTAPLQVQEFNFANQQGEVNAWNNPGASDMLATIDNFGCDFQFNVQDSQSIIYTQQDDETTRSDAFHIADRTGAATSTIGPIHLNPYTIANVADQAHPPVPQPTATIQVDIAAVTNKTAAPESSDPALVQTRPTSNANQDVVQDVEAQDSQPTGTTGIVISATTNETAVSESRNHAFVQWEPTSNANQDFAQDVVESQEKGTEPTSIEPENGKSKAVVQRDFGTGKSHEFSEEAMSSHKKLRQLLDRASAPNTLPSSSSSTPTRDSQAIATVRAILEMDFIAMADEVQRTHMISGIQSLVYSNCLPTGTGSPIMDMLKQLEKSVPAYSEAYSEYDMGKNLTGQVEASKQLLQPTVQFCDSMEKELQELEEKKMKIEARQVAIRKEMHDTVKETEPKQARLTKLLQQQDQFKGKEGKLMTILDIGNGMWTTLKNTIHRHLPT